MTAKQLITITSFILICLTSNSQVSLSIGASNRFQSHNTYEKSVGYSETKRTIREQNVFDSYSIGVEYQRKKLNLMFDVSLNANNLTVESQVENQVVNDHIRAYKNYSISYGFLGVTLSPQFMLNTKPENFDLSIGPLFQFQWKLYERESEHWDSLYHYHSYYNNWTGASSNYTETSSSTEEFDGMTLTSQAVRMGFSVNSKIKIEQFQITFSVAAGMGLTSRRDNLYPVWDDVYGFAEVGIKLGYQLRAK